VRKMRQRQSEEERGAPRFCMLARCTDNEYKVHTPVDAR
jgi:hypothetical protein